MAKPIVGTLLLILSSSFLAAHAQQYSCPDGYDCRPYPPPPTRIYFKIVIFVFISTSGECQNIYQVAAAPIASCSPARFPSIGVIDSPARAFPSVDSPILGRMQGTLASVDSQRPVYLRNLAFVFNPEYYNGSTLIVTDRIVRGTESVNEVQITGGTGLFYNPRGRAVRTVYTTNGATGETITRYDFDFYTEQE